MVVVLVGGCLAEPTPNEERATGPLLEVPGLVENGAWDFGEVLVGEVGERDLILRNVGDQPLMVRTIGLDGAPTVDVREPLGIFAIEPGAEATLTLRYTPEQDELLQARLEFVSNDALEPTRTIPFTANGLGPTVRIDPESFDFGDLTLGCDHPLDVTITNVGRAPLRLEEVWLDDRSSAGELSIEHEIVAGLVLDPGERTSLEVLYVPLDETPDIGVLHVESNDPVRPVATARQEGTAHAPDMHTETFVQADTNAADALWVVGKSTSMQAHQTTLADALPAWFEVLDALGNDYRAAVLTDDLADAGVLQGSTPIVTPITPAPALTLGGNVQVGAVGSAVSEGFESVVRCYAGGDCAGVFDRADASTLQINFVSDAEEGSSGRDPSAYVAFFQAARTDPSAVVISNISGGLSGCTGSGATAAAGIDYVAAGAMTGGVSASICDASWTATMASLAWLADYQVDTFSLAQSPVPDSIAVDLNGAPRTSGWTFNPALNAVVFDVGQIPEPGDEIVVDYVSLGTCGD